MTAAMTSLLDKYLDPRNPGSFGGIDRFYESVRDQVEDKEAATKLLQQLNPYNISKENRSRFPRNRVVVTNLRQQFQLDLADLSKYKDKNGSVRFLLFAVDCISKLASVQPLLSKGAVHVKPALETVFKELGEPAKLQVDQGK